MLNEHKKGTNEDTAPMVNTDINRTATSKSNHTTQNILVGKINNKEIKTIFSSTTLDGRMTT